MCDAISSLRFRDIELEPAASPSSETAVHVQLILRIHPRDLRIST
jgi:hypothetical protein